MMSATAAKTETTFVAIVEWLRGKRRVSDILRNAGLGITSAGFKERVIFTYKPGEVVDEARVLRAIDAMIKEAEKLNTEFEISCPKVISIMETTTV